MAPIVVRQAMRMMMGRRTSSRPKKAARPQPMTTMALKTTMLRIQRIIVPTSEVFRMGVTRPSRKGRSDPAHDPRKYCYTSECAD